MLSKRYPLTARISSSLRLWCYTLISLNKESIFTWWDVTLRTLFQNSKIQSLLKFLTHPLCVLFLTNLVVYGFFIPMLGFYWDDMNFYWFFLHSGNSGLAQYFATDGPVMGLFYQLNFNLLGTEPWHWQAFAFFWRWMSAAGAYFLVRQLWKEHREPAFITAMVVLLYPGFSQQYIAICYGHFNLVLSALLFSLGISLYVIEHKKYRIPLSILAVLLAVVNLVSSEYFFMLELLRPILFWVVLSDLRSHPRQRGSNVLRLWWPYLLVFLAASFWRTVIFKSQTETYSFEALNGFTSAPWNVLKTLFITAVKDIWWTVFAAWKKVFEFPLMMDYGKKLTLYYIGISVIVIAVLGVALYFKKTATGSEKGRSFHNSFVLIAVGLAACLLAGVPFWSTNLGVARVFPNDRFTLPFILGSGLIFSGVMFLLPARPYLRRSIFMLLLALAGGLQARIGLSYKRDWDLLQRFMWQLTWRVPSIEPRTIVFSNELPLQYYSDLSITAPLNLTYQTDHAQKGIPYIFYYPTVRKSDPEAVTLQQNLPVEHGLWVGDFSGNTSRSFTLYYHPPDCLRIIDPIIEADNPKLPPYVLETAKLSSSSSPLISPITDQELVDAIYQNEQSNPWCYSFEKADLARQQQDWQQVASIADQVIDGGQNTEEPLEYLVYIDGYAHTEDWQKAVDLSIFAMQVNEAVQPSLCILWQRIAAEAPESSAKTEALAQIAQTLPCPE